MLVHLPLLFQILLLIATCNHTFIVVGSFVIDHRPTKTGNSFPQKTIDKSTFKAKSSSVELISSSTQLIESKNSPYLALITETNACDTDERVNETFETIKNALGETNQNGIDLISIRVIKNSDKDKDDDFQRRVVNLAKRIMVLKKSIIEKCRSSIVSENEEENNDFLVVINDNVNAALESNVDGIHVKESKVSEITKIRQLFQENQQRKKRVNTKLQEREKKQRIIIGTSAHSVDTALSTCRKYSPDYFFVGTCYLTNSHPEKDTQDLEGPSLPGIVRQALCNELKEAKHCRPPTIFAIGGIDDSNCEEPVKKYGADGVAVIRSIMQSTEPRQIVLKMKERMQL